MALDARSARARFGSGLRPGGLGIVAVAVGLLVSACATVNVSAPTTLAAPKFNSPIDTGAVYTRVRSFAVTAALRQRAVTQIVLATLVTNPARRAAAFPAREYARTAFNGVVTWYGREWAGRRTANDERFDPEALTAAHRTLPFNTRLRVTNLKNGQSVVVRVNDRGPRVRGRELDLSRRAAREIGFHEDGLVNCKIEVLN